MKNLCIFIVCIFLIGCDKVTPSFTVMTGNEAIITRDGEIVRGPIKPGLHFKIPFLEEVHEFEIFRLRIWTEELKKEETYLLRIYWNIENSIYFYEQTQQVDIIHELDNIFRSTKSYIEENVDQNVVGEISMMKSKDCDFMNESLKSIVEMTQEKTKLYGVKVSRIDLYSPTS